MITLYNKSTGKPVSVAHKIDAREYVAGGAYCWDDPTKKPEMPIKSEAKPAKIPTIEDKELVEDIAVMEVKPKGKPIIPKRIIRK